MTKREKLENMRREHARERNETRDDEMYRREGEDFSIESIREKMAIALGDAEISAEMRKERLTYFKQEIEDILDARDEREYAFIERELEHHRLEQEIAQEIENEEKINRAKEGMEEKEILPLVRPLITAGAEQMRKEIEERRRQLNESEQCNTILLSNSERGEIPGFAPSRRRKKRAEQAEQDVRIDSLVLKQREISLMYHESQALQLSLLKKNKKFLETKAGMILAQEELEFEEQQAAEAEAAEAAAAEDLSEEVSDEILPGDEIPPDEI